MRCFLYTPSAVSRLAGFTFAGIVVLAMAGCDGSGSPLSDSDPEVTFPADPNPVAVIAVPDESRAVSGVITTQGGTLTATGDDGSRFTLTVPTDALLEATLITMTPIIRVDGLPMSGGLAAAVHLEPEGLRFHDAVTLVIEPAEPVPVAQQMTFSAARLGEDFHLHPPALEESITLHLLHFSTAGVGAGTEADVEAQHGHPPQSVAAQLQQRLAAVVSRERQAVLSGADPNPEFGNQILDLLEAYRDDVVEPALREAEQSGDPEVIGDALRIALEWERTWQIMGGEGSLFSQITDLAEKLAGMLFSQAYDQCMQVAGEAVRAPLQTMLSAARMAALWGAAPDDPRFAFSKIAECAARSVTLPERLELRIETEVVSEEVSENIVYEISALSVIELEQQANMFRYIGTAAIEYQEFTITNGSSCVRHTVEGTVDGQWTLDLYVMDNSGSRLRVYFRDGNSYVWPVELVSQQGIAPPDCGDNLDHDTEEKRVWVQGWQSLLQETGYSTHEYWGGLSIPTDGGVSRIYYEDMDLEANNVTSAQASFELRVLQD